MWLSHQAYRRMENSKFYLSVSHIRKINAIIGTCFYLVYYDLMLNELSPKHHYITSPAEMETTPAHNTLV